MKDPTLEELTELLEGAYTSACIPSGPTRERAEVYMIGIINKIIRYAEQKGLKQIPWLAHEAKETGNAEQLITTLREILQ